MRVTPKKAAYFKGKLWYPGEEFDIAEDEMETWLRVVGGERPATPVESGPPEADDDDE